MTESDLLGKFSTNQLYQRGETRTFKESQLKQDVKKPVVQLTSHIATMTNGLRDYEGGRVGS